MAARVCDSCDVSYPTMITECRVCKNTLRYAGSATPDVDWSDRADDLLAARNRPAGPPFIRLNPVRDENGRRWLYCGPSHNGPLADFDHLLTPEGIVELQGYDAPRRRWWIEVLS